MTLPPPSTHESRQSGTTRHFEANFSSSGASRPSADRRGADRAIVAQLISGDDTSRNDAWKLVLDTMVAPLVKADVKGIRSQCERAGVHPDAISSRLFANLTRNDSAALRSFRFECAFKSWIYWHVWDAAQGAIREVSEKIDVEVSDDGEMPTLTDTKTPAPDRAIENSEFLQNLNGLLAALWRENPMRAVVLLLRGELNLSSRDVGAFLGKEPANVDQIHYRAQKSMRILRRAAENAEAF